MSLAGLPSAIVFMFARLLVGDFVPTLLLDLIVLPLVIFVSLIVVHGFLAELAIFGVIVFTILLVVPFVTVLSRLVI